MKIKLSTLVNNSVITEPSLSEIQYHIAIAATSIRCRKSHSAWLHLSSFGRALCCQATVIPTGLTPAFNPGSAVTSLTSDDLARRE